MESTSYPVGIVSYFLVLASFTVSTPQSLMKNLWNRPWKYGKPILAKFFCLYRITEENNLPRRRTRISWPGDSKLLPGRCQTRQDGERIGKIGEKAYVCIYGYILIRTLTYRQIFYFVIPRPQSSTSLLLISRIAWTRVPLVFPLLPPRNENFRAHVFRVSNNLVSDPPYSVGERVPGTSHSRGAVASLDDTQVSSIASLAKFMFSRTQLKKRNVSVVLFCHILNTMLWIFYLFLGIICILRNFAAFNFT